MLKPVIRILTIAIASYSVASCGGGGSGNSGLQTGESNSPAFFRLGSIVSPEESPEYSNANSNGVAALEAAETPKPLERRDPIEVTFQYTTLSPTYIWSDRTPTFSPQKQQDQLYPNISWSDYSSDVGVQAFEVSKSKALDKLFGFKEHSNFEKQYGTLTTQFDNGNSEIKLEYDGIYHPASDSLIFFVQEESEAYDPEIDERWDRVFHTVVGMTNGDSAYTMPKGTFNYEGVNMVQTGYFPAFDSFVTPRQFPIKIEKEGPFSMRVNFDVGTGSFESMVRGVRSGKKLVDPCGGAACLFRIPPPIQHTYFKEFTGYDNAYSGNISVNAETGSFVGENISVNYYHTLPGKSETVLWRTSKVRLQGQFQGKDASSVIGTYKGDDHKTAHGAIIGERVD